MANDKVVSPVTPENTQRTVSRRRRKGQKVLEQLGSSLERLQIEEVPIDTLYPNPYNPNRQSVEEFGLLQRSIKEDGFTQPIIATQNGEIVDGEHRWRACRAIGLTTIAVVRVTMTPEQMRIATIRHNRARGSHDVDLEADVLRDLQKLGALSWAQESLMMSDSEINRLLNVESAADAFAEAEYSESWVPDKFTDDEMGSILDGEKTADAEIFTDDDGNETGMVAMTPRAIQVQREREAVIQAAATPEERDQLRRDRQIYRVRLIFSDQEADLVTAVLGTRPAERLLHLCQVQAEEKRLV